MSVSVIVKFSATFARGLIIRWHTPQYYVVPEITLTSPLQWIYFTLMFRKRPKYYHLYSVEDLGMKSLFSDGIVNIRV